MTTQLTHRAIVRRGSRSSVEKRPTPTPGPGELLVAPEKVSLCGTDIQIVRGDRDDPRPSSATKALPASSKWATASPASR